MTRPHGFYWVRWKHTRLVDDEPWEVAEWHTSTNSWFATGSEIDAYDDDFQEIGPRIEPPPKNA